MDSNKTHTWLIAGLIGLVFFLISAVAEGLINVYLFKKYHVCPYAPKREEDTKKLSDLTCIPKVTL